MKVHCLKALETNYFFVLEKNGKAVVFDPGDAQVISQFLSKSHLQLEAIWCTHHHWDHIDGVNDLLEEFSVPVFASDYDLNRLPFQAHGLKENDFVEFQEHRFKVLELPGHTLGHIGFYCDKSKMLFSADTLFSLGCGRLFEGTPEQMFKTLEKLKSLPSDTWIYFSHEYTIKNFEFLRSVFDKAPCEGSLNDLEKSLRGRLASEGKTVPSTLEFELRNNPFLRSDLKTFTEIRSLRDQF